MTGPTQRPVLWQLELSHYNEKVRWALDLKRIDHVRRPLLPGAHLLIARPASFPYPIPEVPATGREFMDSLANRPIGAWVARMYERHRAAPGVRRTLSVGGR